MPWLSKHYTELKSNHFKSLQEQNPLQLNTDKTFKELNSTTTQQH